MKKDLSLELYKKYFNLKNPKIEITLKDKSILTGMFIGFFKACEDANGAYISQWRFVDKNDPPAIGSDPFGFGEGIIINQKDIVEVHFYDDDSVMKF
jgi:hypothetical protein